MDFELEQATLQSSIRFCHQSLAVRATVHLGDVPAGEMRLPLKTKPSVELFQVLQVTSEGRALQRHRDWAPGGDSVIFTTAFPDADATCALTTHLASTRAPDILYLKYADVVADGAVARLLLQQGKPWEDAQRAEFYHARFIDGYRRAYRDTVSESSVSGVSNPIRRQQFF